jgi:transcriptional regulator with XRE-family HTH domain
MQADRFRLAAVLERNRLQQKHVAEALPVSRMTVLMWVHGRTVPTGDNLLRLLAYLRRFEPGLQVEDLLAVPAPSAESEAGVVAGESAA